MNEDVKVEENVENTENVEVEENAVVEENVEVKEAESKETDEKVSKDDEQINVGEKLRYQINSTSYLFGLLAVVLDAAFIFVAFNQMNIYQFGVQNDVVKHWVIFPKILINIFLILASFLGSEKTKTYSEKWSIVMFIFGIVAILRIFFVPLFVITGNTVLVGKTDSDAKRLTMGIILIVILGLMAASYMICGLVGYKKSKTLHKYLESIDTSLN